MPRHQTSLGAGQFPVASKMLRRYEQERAYRIHKQKLSQAQHNIDTTRPKKYPHLILRLKAIQQEEEKQARIDHDNKLLLNKMTHVMKHGGALDNWNDYESRSLNYPFRERQNEEIARENIGIARRLEHVRPVYRKDKWQRDYGKHSYLKSMLTDSTKDYGDFTPRRMSRMSRVRSLDNSYEEDFEESEEDEDRLPRLHGPKSKRSLKSTKSEPQPRTKLPSIQQKPFEHTYEMYWGELYQEKSEKFEPPNTEGEQHQGVAKGGAQASKGGAPAAAKAKAQPEPQDDSSDIGLLFKVAKQLARPDDIFIRVLVKKTPKQRMLLKDKFRQKYDLDLITELKSGLGLPWEHLIDAFLMDQGVADSFAVFDAFSAQQGKKTSDYSDIVELLCSRDSAGLASLKETYRKEFSISLEEDIADRSKEPVQTLLLALCKGSGDDSTEVDSKEVWEDAVALHESGEGRWTSENGKFIKMLNERSLPHIRAVLMEYKAASGGTEALDVIKQECPRDYVHVMNTLVSCVKSPQSHYAEVFFKHKNPTDPVLVHTLVQRAEVDIPQIRRIYKKKYEVDLVDDIKSKSHPTVKVLVELANKVPPGSKGKESQTKKAYSKPTSVVQTQKKQPIKRPENGSKTGTKTSEEGMTDRSDNPLSQPSKRVQADAAKQRKDDEAKERLKEDSNHNGTVKPAKNFNADDDVDRLHNALHSSKTDESVIIDILPRRSNKQRQEIKRRYEEKFKKNLMIDLESELSGDFEEIVLALMMLPVEYDAYCIHEAVEGLGTSEATLIGILCTRSGKDIKAIRDHYKKAYKTDMVTDIAADISGDFANMIKQLCQGEREQGSEVNLNEAKEDAKRLYKDGQVSLDPNDETFKAILAKKNHAQVKATFDEYKKLTGNDIYYGINKAMLGDDEDGYIGLAKAVEDPVTFYAERLHSCFSGVGTNDNMLIRIVVSRSEIDLQDIKKRYQELYQKTLSKSVESECSGEYKQMLIAIIDQNDSKPKTKKTADKGKTQQPRPPGPTVFPVNPFDPADDCVRLASAMKGFGTDETVLIDIIPRRSNEQRQVIKNTYQEKYETNLMIELESELRGDFEEIVLALMMTPTAYDVHCLHDAMCGIGTAEDMLIGILATRTKKEMNAIKNQYKSMYGKDLETAIKSDTSGDFEELLVELLRGERVEGSDVNLQEAKEDAKKLYKDGQISIDPKEETFKDILAKKSSAQVRATFLEYEKLVGNDIYQGIEKAMLGDSEDGYVALAKAVEDPIQFYAERLHKCFEGIGTNDKMLIRIVVSRSEIDLQTIKKRYKELYKKALSESIEDECSGDYKRLLLVVVGDK